MLSLLLFMDSVAQEYGLVILGNSVDITKDQTYSDLRIYLENIDTPYSILLPGDITSTSSQFRYPYFGQKIIIL